MTYDVIWGPHQYSKLKAAVESKDDILAMKLQLGNWVAVSNYFSCLESVSFKEELPPQYAHLQACGTPENPPTPLSFSTTFDDQPLSRRSLRYQETAINYFADQVLSDYLTPKTLTIAEDVFQLDSQGRRVYPTRFEDVLTMLNHDKTLAHKIQIIRREFDPRSLTPDARRIIRAILEDAESRDAYLANAEAFIQQYGRGDMTSVEYGAFIVAAHERQNTVLNTFDHVELGRSTIGDLNTICLIGCDADTRLPNPAGMDWFLSNYATFGELNGFVPPLTYYVSQAQLQYRVIAGPGTTPREHDFLYFSGARVLDHSDGSPFDQKLAALDETRYIPERLLNPNSEVDSNEPVPEE